jgi:hypothetical protein
MCNVTRIEWTYRTTGAEGDRDDSRVSVEIYRDGELLAELRDDAEAAHRLERGNSKTRGFTFRGVPGVRIVAGDAVLPYFERFGEGVHGHLDVRFRVDGYDAWQIRGIESTLVRGELRPAFGADHDEWVELHERFVFPGVGVIGAEPSDETAILTLSY